MFSLTKLNPEIISEEDNKQTKSKHNDAKSSSIQKYKVSEDICVAICLCLDVCLFAIYHLIIIGPMI